jgi:Fucose-binding lectin II (PA-IIL)
MNYPNPYATVIPGDSSYSFTAMANAAYFQRAIVSLGGQQAAVFNGQGEGVPMLTSGGGSSYGGATRGPAQVSVLFQFSTDGVNYGNAMVAEVLSTPTTVMVGTEDSTDGDNNDTVLTLSIAQL